jgi:hypothetical protein
MKRNIAKRSLVLLVGIIAIGAVTGLGLAGCKHDPDGSDIPSELLGAWYRDSNDNGVLDEPVNNITKAYEFKANGDVWWQGSSSQYTFSVDGNKITIYYKDLGTAVLSYTFEIDSTGKKLTLTGLPTSSGGASIGGVFLKE